MENQQQQMYSFNNQEDKTSQYAAGSYFNSSSSKPSATMLAPKEEVNTSCNHNGSACFFDMPECVIDVYLEAINGGTSRDERLRSISQRFGQQKVQEGDFNCNHNVQDVPPGYCGGCHTDPCYDPAKNVNPEPLPNQGCGCTGSYNGGAGAGTADCGCDAYDPGFNDKRRDHSCPCNSPEAKRSHKMGTSHGHNECPYERDLCNKKAVSSCCTGLSEVEYKPEVVNNKPVLPSCCCEGGPYEKDHLVNKKPSICSPCGPEFHSSCEKPKHCHLSEHRTHRHEIPDRRCFYTDEECGTSTVLKRCNNNSCNVDLVYDACAVGCVPETSYFPSNLLDLQQTTVKAIVQDEDTNDDDDDEEEQQETAVCNELLSRSPMYTTVALESDEARDHEGKRWAKNAKSTRGSLVGLSHSSNVNAINTSVDTSGKGCTIA